MPSQNFTVWSKRGQTTHSVLHVPNTWLKAVSLPSISQVSVGGGTLCRREDQALRRAGKDLPFSSMAPSNYGNILPGVSSQAKGFTCWLSSSHSQTPLIAGGGFHCSW